MKHVLQYLYEILEPSDRSRGFRLLLIFLPAAALEALAISIVLPFVRVVTDVRDALTNPAILKLYNALGEAWYAVGITSEFQVRYFFALLGGGMFGLLIAANLMKIWGIRLIQFYCRDQSNKLSVRLLRRYMHQPYAYFLTRNRAVTSKNILMEAEQVVYAVLQPMLDIAAHMTVILILLLTLLLHAPSQAMIMAAVIGLVYMIFYRVIRNKLYKIGKSRVEANGGRFKAVSEAFNGIKELKLRNRENILIEQYESPSKAYCQESCKHEIISRTTGYMVELFAICGIGAVVLLLLYQDRPTHELLALIGLFMVAVQRIMPAFQRVYTSVTRIRTNHECVRMIHHELFSEELLGGEQQERSKSDTVVRELPPMKEQFELVGLSYRYPSADQGLFENLNFQVKKGEVVGIIGTTGCGKTTLADICLGLLQPQQGDMRLDGQRIEKEHLAAWQKKVGYVPQHVYLSDDTIARNIAFAVHDDELDMSAVRRAAKIAQIDGFIENELPDAYETGVGERGIRLSGGQIQRLGIARALYHDPEILFFDEATSALDVQTERAVMESLFEISGERTVLLIAHRLHTIKRCSRIVMLSEGKIVAEGRYDSLVAESPHFREFVQHMPDVQ